MRLWSFTARRGRFSVGKPTLFDSPVTAFCLRALFPSWRFFEDLDWVPRLWVRVLPANDFQEPWKECFAPESRGAASLFLNARGNLRMAAHSLVERFVAEIGESTDEDMSRIEASVSYELVTRLVRYRLKEMGETQPGKKFQFKIVSAVPGKLERSSDEELLISRVHEI
jgi:hypothetical protein